MALISAAFDDILVRVARAVAPYGPRVVLVGGSASALFRHHPASANPSPRPLLTLDADLVASVRGLPKVPTLHDQLTRLGLVAVPSDRPANKYRLTPESNESIEILCPLTGLPKETRLRRPALVEIQPGTTAEGLDYVDMLLVNPWSVDLAQIPGLDVTETLPISIPNPVSYVLQKCLVRRQRRGQEKRDKDSYYIYDVALVFRNAMERMAQEAVGLRAAIVRKWYHDAAGQLEHQFGHERAPGVLEAVDIGRAHGLELNAAMVERTVSRLRAAVAG
jgi:hypothetical protein